MYILMFGGFIKNLNNHQTNGNLFFPLLRAFWQKTKGTYHRLLFEDEQEEKTRSIKSNSSILISFIFLFVAIVL